MTTPKGTHMYVNEAAAIIGIKPATLRKFLRGQGTPTQRGARARYEFTAAEVYELRDRFFNKQPLVTSEYVDDSAPGLPVEALRDHSMRNRFQALRRERSARLDALLRERQMTVAQMSDESLISTGRILRDI